MDINLKEFYTSRAQNFKNENIKYTDKIKKINILRGITFVLTAIGAIVSANYSLTVMFSILTVGIIVFLKLVQLNAKYLQMQKYFEAMQIINENEIKAVNNNNSEFYNGAEFIDSQHDYSYDLDIFGEKSIFQKINRCATTFGKNFLADKLKNPIFDSEKILEIHKATKQLENEIENRQNFLAESIIQKNDIEKKDIEKLSKEEFYFINNKKLKIFTISIVLITNILILLTIFTKISYVLPMMCYFLQFFLISYYGKKTNALSEKISNHEKIFNKYQNLFKILEETSNKSEYVKNILFNPVKSEKISTKLKEIEKISKLYNHRHNLAFAIIAEGLFMYDILINIKFEKWINENAKNITKWFVAIAECDYLFSLATLKFNNKDWCFPEPKKEKFLLKAHNAGHPLIKSEKCVKNDIDFCKNTYLQIITGANMAGKSTYLRTAGTNLVLAQAGAAVCAQSFEWQPVALCTSIRTTDSVQDNESYFFAELKRLQHIVKRLENNETLFIIVDEMLRGTNSKDKHDGSEKFLLKLLKYNCIGLFATHDIDIGNMKADFPENIDTKCFEIAFNDDKLIFDYTLKDGISKNLNASFLMKKMGIIE